MSKCHSLPGIVCVGYVPCSALRADISCFALVGVKVSVDTTPTDIALLGETVCEVEEQFDNNRQVEKAKLTFYTLDEVPTRQHLAFVIKTADGNSYILGAKELPYPTVKVTGTTGQPDGDASVRKYEVSYNALKTLAALSQ